MGVSTIGEILQNFVSGTSDVQGAALVSPDGLPLASSLPGTMDEERTSAMSAAMLSLGERIGKELSRGTVEKVMVEGNDGYGILIGCGEDAVSVDRKVFWKPDRVVVSVNDPNRLEAPQNLTCECSLQATSPSTAIWHDRDRC